MWNWLWHYTISISKASKSLLANPDAAILAEVGSTFHPEGFDWKQLRVHQLFYRCPSSTNMISGKLLAHCKRQVIALREEIGIRVCCFKIGITANPPQRFSSYVQKNYSCMWVIASSECLGTISMLEAALISEYQKHIGCKNQPETGGEGALNRSARAIPPFFCYITAGRADQARWVG